MSNLVMPFELDRRQHPVPRVLALRVIEHPGVIEHILPGFLACSICSPPDPFAFEQVEEALGDGIVVTVSSAAHGVRKIVGPQEGCPVDAGELAALIGADQNLCLQLAPPDSHEQRLQDDVGGLAALHQPADHAP